MTEIRTESDDSVAQFWEMLSSACLLGTELDVLRTRLADSFSALTMLEDVVSAYERVASLCDIEQATSEASGPCGSHGSPSQSDPTEDTGR